MYFRLAALFLLASPAFAVTAPCDVVAHWQQLAPLKALSQDVLSSKASAGDALAQYYLATRFLDGKEVAKDQSVGGSWMLRSATNGFSRAQLVLGQVYESGKLAPQDESTALAWYMRAAEQGDCEAELFLGVHYLGHHFNPNRGVWDYSGAKDPGEAVSWLEAAAAHGNPDAQVQLGRLYEDGEGVAQDYAAAAFWYLKAADHAPDLGGAGQGRNQLALLYLEGRGVPKDYVEAYKWFALTGNKQSLGEVAAEMTRAQEQEAQRRVLAWKQKHEAALREGEQVFGWRTSE